MSVLKSCAHCGGVIKEKAVGGIHLYECQNPECGSCTSFIGSELVDMVCGQMICEAPSPQERFNLRAAPDEPLTNGDLIRHMSNEELASTMFCPKFCPNETGNADIVCNQSDDRNCYRCTLTWLNQSVGRE